MLTHEQIQELAKEAKQLNPYHPNTTEAIIWDHAFADGAIRLDAMLSSDGDSKVA